MGKRTLTIKQGLQIQSEHLAEWKTKLNAECFADLAAWLAQENEKEHADGYAVARGTSLDQFIANWNR